MCSYQARLSQPFAVAASGLAFSGEISPFHTQTPLSISGFRVAEVVYRFAELFVIPPEPAAPTLIIGEIHAVLNQPLGQSPEMVSIPEQRFGAPQIFDNDSPSPILVHGRIDHH